MPLPPPLTDEQRRRALEKAAEARRQRAELKEQLKSGRISLENLFDRSGDDIVGKMTVFSALVSLPGVGEKRATLFMEEAGIKKNRRIRGLGDKQKSRLLEFSRR